MVQSGCVHFAIILFYLTGSFKRDDVKLIPVWLQKEWFPDFMALLVGELLELSMLWNLLVQPHIRKVMGLGSMSFLGWKLLSDLSTGQAFVKRLRKLSQLTSGNSQHVSISESVKVIPLVS